MSNFENLPKIVATKNFLRTIFTEILNAVEGAFKGFYNWLKNVPIPVPPSMLKMFSNNKANVILFFLVLVYVFYMNIKTYILFAADKRYAKRKEARISEKRLFTHMWLGGALGGGLAMIIYHHKTLHKNFTVTAIVLVVLQMLLFSFILGFLGFWTFF